MTIRGSGASSSEVVYAPVGGFLRYLCQGWRFPGPVVQPMMGHHGTHSCLLIREVR